MGLTLFFTIRENRVNPIFLLAPGSWLRLEQELGREVIGLLRSIFPDKYLTLREIKKMPLYQFRRNPERLKVYLRDLDRLERLKARIGEEAFLRLCERASQEQDGLVYLSCLKDVLEDVTIKFENGDEITLPFIAALTNMQVIKELKPTLRLILIRDMATEGKKVFIPEVDEIERYNLEALTLLSRMANQGGIAMEEVESLLGSVGNMLEACINGFRPRDAQPLRDEYARIKAQVLQEARTYKGQAKIRLERHIAAPRASLPEGETRTLNEFVIFLHNATRRELFNITNVVGEEKERDRIYKRKVALFDAQYKETEIGPDGEVLHWQERPKQIIAGWEDIAKMKDPMNPARLVFDNIGGPISSSRTYLRVSGTRIEAMLDYGGVPGDPIFGTTHNAGLQLRLPSTGEPGYLRFSWNEANLQDNLRMKLMRRLFEAMGLDTMRSSQGILNVELKAQVSRNEFIETLEQLLKATSGQGDVDLGLARIHQDLVQKQVEEGKESKVANAEADKLLSSLIDNYVRLFIQFGIKDIDMALKIAEGKRSFPPLVGPETRNELNRVLSSLGINALPSVELGPFEVYRHFVGGLREKGAQIQRPNPVIAFVNMLGDKLPGPEAVFEGEALPLYEMVKAAYIVNELLPHRKPKVIGSIGRLQVVELEVPVKDGLLTFYSLMDRRDGRDVAFLAYPVKGDYLWQSKGANNILTDVDELIDQLLSAGFLKERPQVSMDAEGLEEILLWLVEEPREEAGGFEIQIPVVSASYGQATGSLCLAPRETALEGIKSSIVVFDAIKEGDLPTIKKSNGYIALQGVIASHIMVSVGTLHKPGVILRYPGRLSIDKNTNEPVLTTDVYIERGASTQKGWQVRYLERNEDWTIRDGAVAILHGEGRLYISEDEEIRSALHLILTGDAKGLIHLAAGTKNLSTLKFIFQELYLYRRPFPDAVAKRILAQGIRKNPLYRKLMAFERKAQEAEYIRVERFIEDTSDQITHARFPQELFFLIGRALDAIQSLRDKYPALWDDERKRTLLESPLPVVAIEEKMAEFAKGLEGEFEAMAQLGALKIFDEGRLEDLFILLAQANETGLNMTKYAEFLSEVDKEIEIRIQAERSLYALRLGDVKPYMHKLVGGKAVDVAMIKRRAEKEGLPYKVPDGYIITSQAFRSSASRAISEFAEILSGEMSLSEKSEILQEKIMLSAIDSSISQKISEIHNDYLNKHNLTDEEAPIIVRSSATTNIEERQYGVFASFANRRGLPDILEQIKKMWAERWKPEFVEGELEMATLIQTMKDAVASGVLNSVDVMERRHNEIVISASFGLGEGPVSGATSSGDRFVIDKTTRRIIQRDIDIKKERIRLVPHPHRGTAKEEIPVSEQTRPSLSDGQIDTLVSISNRLEKRYRHFLNFEFALVGDELFLFQKRRTMALDDIVEKGREYYSGFSSGRELGSGL